MKVKEMVYGAILTSLALIIPLSFGGVLGVNTPLFSATLASHVPCMLAMTISPWVAFMVGAGSAWGFFMKLGAIVGARAFMHTIFATIGAILFRKGFSLGKILILTAPIHALSEALIVLPFGFSLYNAGVVVGIGTLAHHGVDSIITILLYNIIIVSTGFAFIHKD